MNALIFVLTKGVGQLTIFSTLVGNILTSPPTLKICHSPSSSSQNSHSFGNMNRSMTQAIHGNQWLNMKQKWTTLSLSLANISSTKMLKISPIKGGSGCGGGMPPNTIFPNSAMVDDEDQHPWGICVGLSCPIAGTLKAKIGLLEFSTDMTQ